MDFEQVIFSRHSTRDFLEKDIPEDILAKIIEAGRSAPSFQNKQCWRYIICLDREIIKKLALESGLIGKVNFFLKQAPLVIVACADPARSGIMNDQDYYLVDTAISFQQMMLTAWNFGIGSCWLAAFDEKKIKDILTIPADIRVVAMSPFGYPREKKAFYSKAISFFAGSKKRLRVNEIVFQNKWGQQEEL
jgi:nitroreductase